MNMWLYSFKDPLNKISDHWLGCFTLIPILYLIRQTVDHLDGLKTVTVVFDIISFVKGYIRILKTGHNSETPRPGLT